MRYKRLDRGSFAIVDRREEGAAHVEVDDATFEALLDGIVESGPSPSKRKRTQRVH